MKIASPLPTRRMLGRGGGAIPSPRKKPGCGGLLFGLSDGGNLFCINAKTGQTAWTDATQRDRGGFGPVVSAGSCLLALPSSSELIVFQPTDKQYSEVAKIKVAETATYAHPVLAGNRIYVKDAESLALWTLN